MNNLKHLLILVSLLSVLRHTVHAQNLLEIAGNGLRVDNTTIATFKSTRLIGLHTIETIGERSLDFRISHRFGPFNSGTYQAFGLDGSANIRLALEYCTDGRLMFGIGRSSYEKMVDAFIKYRLVLQSNDCCTPVSVTLLAAGFRVGQKDNQRVVNGYDRYDISSHRFSYVYQALIARKFNEYFSVQVAPWFVHRNLASNRYVGNDHFGVALAARLKFTKRQAVVFEYCKRAEEVPGFYNSQSIGWEIETGGHVFQMYVSNSFGIAEIQFLEQTDSKWGNAGIRLGFNVSRVFSF